MTKNCFSRHTTYAQSIYGLILFILFLFFSSTLNASETEPNLSFIIENTSHQQNKNDILGGFTVYMPPGWHTYWKWNQETGKPISIDWSNSINIKNIEILWLIPEEVDYFGINVYGYQKPLILPLKITLIDPNLPFKLDLKVSIFFCDSASCKQLSYAFKFDSSQPDSAIMFNPEEISEYLKQVPTIKDLSKLTNISTYITRTHNNYFYNIVLHDVKEETTFNAIVIPDNNIQLDGFSIISRDDKNVTISVPFIPVDQNKDRKNLYMFDTYLTYGSQNVEFKDEINLSKVKIEYSRIFFSIIFALLGGLILNIMPNILPIFLFKILQIANLSKNDLQDVRPNSLISALGILTTFFTIAVFTTVLYYFSIPITWGMFFQNPMFVFTMAVLITLLSCNLFGFYEIIISSISYNPLKIKGEIAQYINETIATILAVPCSGPFLAASIGFGLSQSPIIMVSIILFIGLGFALPYLLMATIPNQIKKILPKPGTWINNLQYIVAFSFLGAVAWLVWILGDMISPLGVTLVLILLCAIILILLIIHYTDADWIKEFIWGGILISAIGVGVYLHGTQLSQRSEITTNNCVPFETAKIQNYLIDGKTVIINFSAKWCITCLYNENIVLSSKKIQEVIKDPNIIYMKADWTNPDQTIVNFLKKYNQASVPFCIVFSSQYPQGKILNTLLTRSEVLHALGKN